VNEEKQQELDNNNNNNNTNMYNKNYMPPVIINKIIKKLIYPVERINNKKKISFLFFLI
jgi:hypothetical protein